MYFHSVSRTGSLTWMWRIQYTSEELYHLMAIAELTFSAIMAFDWENSCTMHSKAHQHDNFLKSYFWSSYHLLFLILQQTLWSPLPFLHDASLRKDEDELQVFKNRVLRKIFGTMEDDISSLGYHILSNFMICTDHITSLG